MVVSREAKKPYATNEGVFTRSTAQNLAGTVNKPPRKLSLRFCWPGTFLLYRIDTPTIEEIGATNPENQPLQILWCSFCAYTRQTIRLTLIYSLLEN